MKIQGTDHKFPSPFGVILFQMDMLFSDDFGDSRFPSPFGVILFQICIYV